MDNDATHDDKHDLLVVVLQSTCSISDGHLDRPDNSSNGTSTCFAKMFDCPVTRRMGPIECMHHVHQLKFQQ